MAGKITDYTPLTTLSDGDLSDWSNFDEVSAYDSRSVSWADLKTNIQNQITFDNIYTQDDTITANRTVTLSTNDLDFDVSGGGNFSIGVGVGVSTENIHFGENLRLDGRAKVTHDNYVFNGTTVTSFFANNRGNMLEFFDGGGVSFNDYSNLLGANTGTQNWNSYFVDYNFAASKNAGSLSGLSYLYFDQNGANSQPFTRMGINGQNTTFDTLVQITLDKQGTTQVADPTVVNIVDSYGAHSVDFAGIPHYKTGFKSELTDTFATTGTGSGVVRSFWADAQGGDDNQAFYAENGDIVLDNGRLIVDSYTVAGVPTAIAGGVIYVSDETGGAVLAFSDGTNWRRVTDRAIVA